MSDPKEPTSRTYSLAIEYLPFEGITFSKLTDYLLNISQTWTRLSVFALYATLKDTMVEPNHVATEYLAKYKIVLEDARETVNPYVNYLLSLTKDERIETIKRLRSERANPLNELAIYLTYIDITEEDRRAYIKDTITNMINNLPSVDDLTTYLKASPLHENK